MGSSRKLTSYLMMILLPTLACGPAPSPDNLIVYREKANRYIAEGRCDKAIKELQKILQVDDRDAATYRKIAGCFEKIDEPDSAITYFEGAIVFNPADREAYEKVGDIYFNKAEYHEAMTWYERAQQIGYLSSDSYLKLGLIYQTWREFEQARRNYELAVVVDSTNGEALFGLGTINLIVGDTASALPLLSRAYDSGIQAHAAFKLGQLYAIMKSYDEAIEWFDRCLDADDIDEDLKERAFQLRMEIVMKMKSGQQ